ncbi:UDP-N-acetylmuramoyl-L-alanyl-D-glutamate--2,6-diaminopimelate ligase [Aliikangiella sp. IMCC44359]|uniref:UDP-N-acetylmuramoyl-L-alanyl-D-glutamate--2, 6-diaminopimelate ligase n=1 Tax=Aliikangiella sp. IMCC44359 TaxID=3459125 RepID=UPI00403AA113
MAELLLQNILKNIIDVQVSDELLNMSVGALKLDSRQVNKGDTFVAVMGYVVDGRKFIQSALDSGASLVIAEAENNAEFVNQFEQDSPIIWINQLNKQLSLLAANYYQEPSRLLKVIGVTGTNGKTSCSYLITKTLQKLHFECFLLGTLGVGQSSNLEDCNNTTVDAITMQRVLAEANQAGAQFASMEVSSHGLDQERAGAVCFNTAVYTNLTRDHLDYHETMENYGAAKRKLFLSPELKNAVINMDDRFGRKLASDEAITAIKWLVTTKLPTSGSNLNRWVWAEEVVYSIEGIRAKIYTPWGSGFLDSPLIGQFNLSNLLLVIAALGGILKDVNPVLEALKNVRSAPGRMEKFGNAKTPLAVVDYAHTPDALEQSLIALREHCVGLIWCVFGCGGDRDIGKRALMARVAEKLANRIVVTTDNPRTESAENIKQDIFEGFRKPEKVTYIEDRELAITEAIKKAKPGDALLIAGKGHEDYQIIGAEKTYLSDLEITQKVIEGYEL